MKSDKHMYLRNSEENYSSENLDDYLSGLIEEKKQFSAIKDFIQSFPKPEKIEEADISTGIFKNAAKSYGLPDPLSTSFFYDIKQPILSGKKKNEIEGKAAVLRKHCINISKNSSSDDIISEMPEVLRSLWRITADEQKTELEQALRQSLDKAKQPMDIPRKARGVWFTGAKENITGKEISEEFCNNIRTFLVENKKHTYTIYTDDVKSTKGACKKVFGNDRDLWERFEVCSWKDPFEKKWGEHESLKPTIFKAIAWQCSRESGEGFNPQSACDIMRWVSFVGNGGLGDGGLYFDMDTKFSKRFPEEITAPFGVLLGAAGIEEGSGVSLSNADSFESHPWACPDKSIFPCEVLKNIARLYEGDNGATYCFLKASDFPNARTYGNCECGGTTAFLLLKEKYGIDIRRYGRGNFQAPIPANDKIYRDLPSDLHDVSDQKINSEKESTLCRKNGRHSFIQDGETFPIDPIVHASADKACKERLSKDGRYVLPENFPQSFVLTPDGGYFHVAPGGDEWHNKQTDHQKFMTWEQFKPSWESFNLYEEFLQTLGSRDAKIHDNAYDATSSNQGNVRNGPPLIR